MSKPSAVFRAPFASILALGLLLGGCKGDTDAHGCSETSECRVNTDCSAPATCDDACHCVSAECDVSAGHACDPATPCDTGEYCDSNCECVADDCDVDAGHECDLENPCYLGEVCGADCTCAAPGDPLTPAGLAVLTAGGMPMTAFFADGIGSAITEFEAEVTLEVFAPGGDGTSATEVVQLPDQTSTGVLRLDLVLIARGGAAAYDEVYALVVERTAGTDPAEPLTPETVQARGFNISGPEASLAALDDARLELAIEEGRREGFDVPVIDLMPDLFGAAGFTVWFR